MLCYVNFTKLPQILIKGFLFDVFNEKIMSPRQFTKRSSINDRPIKTGMTAALLLNLSGLLLFASRSA